MYAHVHTCTYMYTYAHVYMRVHVHGCIHYFIDFSILVFLTCSHSDV